MPNEAIDPETMAAFLDGRLSGEERARVIDMLAKSGELYEEFIDASAIAAAAESTAPVLELTRGADASAALAKKKRTRWMIGGPILLAAGLAAILITPRVLHQGNLSADPIERLAATMTTASTAPFGSGWNSPAWSATRGAAANLSGEARAFRIGARFVDLDVARRAGDDEAAAQSATALGQLLASSAGGGAVAAMVHEFAQSRGTTAGRAQTVSALRQTDASPDWFDLGTWCESARLAARSGHLDRFVAGGDVLRGLQGILRRISAPTSPGREGVQSSLDELKELSQSGFTKSESSAQAATRLDKIIAALAR